MATLCDVEEMNFDLRFLASRTAGFAQKSLPDRCGFAASMCGGATPRRSDYLNAAASPLVRALPQGFGPEAETRA